MADEIQLCQVPYDAQLRSLSFTYKYAMNSHQLEEVDSYSYRGVEISAKPPTKQ